MRFEGKVILVTGGRFMMTPRVCTVVLITNEGL